MPNPKTASVNFWKVRKLGDREHCNMVIEMVEQEVPTPSIKSMDIKKSSKVVVNVPCAVLDADVTAGDELVLYVPKKQQPETRKQLSIAQQPVAKVAKGK